MPSYITVFYEVKLLEVFSLYLSGGIFDLSSNNSFELMETKNN